jgi:hypothetical protein
MPFSNTKIRLVSDDPCAIDSMVEANVPGLFRSMTTRATILDLRVGTIF